ncbi:hypothetical protein XAC3810_90028 [Xanthomonas citri pv. citri]|uniref:Uncharacterized protein n=1 Tax=Xanthomonas citri pv. citri TaxID=611301 RepID=A0A0U5FIY4_XANCI|nr:hypothetical protein XAC3824_110029 [Xanthomonas citri pv. citri]CEE16376.1 hypothetical protein XAC1083_100028 [Xanthomonas citri pv. citri]CEE17231.1 hypothetical protein XAC902_100029 [Xanthomonas citri pv. citri]CEE26086.1 hypothetical protein XAC908_130022 [Xanthomonas citri pv. citri]CEE42317.1 hypothetical protein XAC9322_80028 [Xanthomonas citri pv. citri]
MDVATVRVPSLHQRLGRLPSPAGTLSSFMAETVAQSAGRGRASASASVWRDKRVATRLQR